MRAKSGGKRPAIQPVKEACGCAPPRLAITAPPCGRAVRRSTALESSMNRLGATFAGRAGDGPRSLPGASPRPWGKCVSAALVAVRTGAPINHGMFSGTPGPPRPAHGAANC